jgi:hypothetical protein
MSGPHFSIIIPTCHRNEDLAKCLERLAPGVQGLDPETYEMIVTDDGSFTTAESLIRERYPHVHWTQGPRRGPAKPPSDGWGPIVALRRHPDGGNRSAWLPRSRE